MSKVNYIKIAKNAFKVTVTLAALYWLSRNFHFQEFKKSILNANYGYLFLALLSYITSQIIASSRLNSFFKTIRLKLSESYNLKLYWLGLLFNFFLPGGVGGDAYKVYFLKKRYPVKTSQLLSAVFFDRLSGMWALAILSCTFLVFMPRFAIPNTTTVLVALIGTASYLYVLYLFFRPFAKRFIQTHVKALAVQGFQILTAILILLAINHTGKFTPQLLIFLISSITAIIPSIGGALGVRDSAAIALGKYLQVDFQLAATVSLIFYSLSLITSLPGIYYALNPAALGEEKLPSNKELKEETSNKEIN